MVVLNAERRFDRVKFQFLAIFCGKLNHSFFDQIVRSTITDISWVISTNSQHNHNVSWMRIGMAVAVSAATTIGKLAAKDRPNFAGRSIVGRSCDLFRRCYWKLLIWTFGQSFWQPTRYIVAGFPSNCEFVCLFCEPSQSF